MKQGEKCRNPRDESVLEEGGRRRVDGPKTELSTHHCPAAGSGSNIHRTHDSHLRFLSSEFELKDLPIKGATSLVLKKLCIGFRTCVNLQDHTMSIYIAMSMFSLLSSATKAEQFHPSRFGRTDIFLLSGASAGSDHLMQLVCAPRSSVMLLNL